MCPLQIVAAQSTLSSTSTAEVRVVCPEDPTLDPKIQKGIQMGESTQGLTHRDKEQCHGRRQRSVTAKVKCLRLG